MVTVGMKGEASVVVSDINTAKVMGSGELPVFATPAMVALLEQAAYTGIQRALNDGEGTVGVHLDVSHDAPSAVGAVIRATAEVVAVEGRKVTFRVEAFDGATRIGGGLHVRYIINNDKFMSKL